MYALSFSAEGDRYWYVPRDPGIAAAALGACASGTPPSTAPAEALHTFTLDSGASRCFFRDSTTLTPLPALVPVRLADPSGGLVVASSSTVLPCPAVPSGSLSRLHLPSFSTNLVSTAALQDAMVTTTTPGGQHVSICTWTRTWRHLATLFFGTTAWVTPPCHAFVACTPVSLSLVSPGLSLPCHPHLPRPVFLVSRGGSAPLLTPSRFPRRLLPCRPSTWTCGAQPTGGEFSSVLLRDFCRGEGILQTFTLPDTPQQKRIAERRNGLFMEGSRAFVRDTSADKLSARAIPCVFLGFVPDAPGWQFYHPTSRRVLPSQDVTFDESVPFYRLFPYRSAPSPPPPLFLAPGPPPVVPFPPQGPAPLGVSQVDPLSGTAPIQVAVVSGAAPGAASGGAASGGAGPGGAGSEGDGSGVAEPEGVEPRGAESEGAESGGAESWGAASSRAPVAGDPGDAGAGGAAVTTAAGDPTEPGAASAGGAGAGVAGVGSPGAGGAGAAGARAVDPGAGGARGNVRPRPYFVPLLQQVLGVPSSTGLPPPFLCPPPDQSQPPLQPASPLPVPSAYTEQSRGLTERGEPASRPVSPVRTARLAPRSRPPPVLGTHTIALAPDPESDRARAASPTVARLLATANTDPFFESVAASALVAELLDFAAACRLDYASALVAESVCASPPSVEGECALGTDVLEDRKEDFECLTAAVPHFASLLLAPEGDPDAPDIPTPHSYAEAITGPSSSQWQAAMDAEMASRKSTGTYIDEVPPPGVNIVDGMWIFRVKRPPGSPPAFKAHYVARGFSQRLGVDYFQTFSPTPKMTSLWVLLNVAAQRDYELHSLYFSTAFLQGSLHEEIWLRRPPGFTGSFPTSTKWSLRRPDYGLRQAPRKWHDTLKTTLAALGFVPSTANPSLFLRTDTSLPPFYVLVYVDDIVFATADTEALTITRDRARRTITLTQSHMVHHVLQRFGFQYSSPQLTPLSTSHSLSAPPSDKSVELSGPYSELVGCLITLGMGLVLGGWGPVFLTRHADASWVDDSATQRSSQGYTFILGFGSVSWRSTRSSSVLSSSYEAEIYARAMAAQELRWLTYLLNNLVEQPRSPPVMYQRGQLRLAYVATRANTADVFTKALPPGDHQRFVTVLGLLALLCFFS
ncbi:unnamed protein product [Closterium sp. NIES-53]